MAEAEEAELFLSFSECSISLKVGEDSGKNIDGKARSKCGNSVKPNRPYKFTVCLLSRW